MEKAYNAFLARRKLRIKALIVFSICTFFFLLALFVLGQNHVWFGNYVGLLGVVVLIGAYYYVMTRSWGNEDVETMVFVEFLRANKALELWSKDDVNAQIYLRDAANHIENALEHLDPISSKTQSRIMTKQFVEPMGNFQKSIRTQILPRIKLGENIEDMKQVMSGLTQLFSDAYKTATIEDIVSKNVDLSRFSPTDTRNLPPSKIRIYWLNIRKNRIAKVLGSLGAGYLIIAVICLVYTIVTRQDFVVFVTQNPTIVILGGLAISGITFWEARPR